MRRLLTANYHRLLKSTWFWICLLATAGWSLFGFVSECYTLETYGSGLGFGTADAIVFDMMEPGFIPAVFVCMFIGTEYSNKTIRIS